jgi:hypothetical protein
MNDPKKPTEEPRRTSQPNELPGQTPPMEAPPRPGTEYERNVPHNPDQSVAKTGEGGEGSYKGTRQYQEGYEQFSRDTSPDDAMRKASEIDPDDPELLKAARVGKTSSESSKKNGGTGGRISAPSIH